eukprot:CAMPEP_0182503826 /NCGR_PEP_ID=MMETSP1321-20130603/16064_1 /TAXON_ID=91990 /ORGANISM="Bolidomonas sp., Strain RCC1657" /LENGTH=53 /DNA_ID=CAMNT_0024709059 /DNA_START=69 /DNA_END=230 /DNA_ORIENTATION=+
MSLLVFDPERGENATPMTYYGSEDDDVSIANATEVDGDDDESVVADGGAEEVW